MARLPNEEAVSLVNAAGKGGAAPTGFARYKYLIWIVVVGCFALFVWDSLEWDKDTGDVELKLHTGNKQPSGDSGVNVETTIPPSDETTKPPIVESSENVEVSPPPSSEIGGGDMGSKGAEDGDLSKTEKRPDEHGGLVDDDLPDEIIQQDTEPVAPEAPEVTTPEPTPMPTEPVTESPTPAPVVVVEDTELPESSSAVLDILSKAENSVNASEPFTPPNCAQQCATHTYQADRFDGADLTLAIHMATRLSNAYIKFQDEVLKPAYGEYFLDIFEPLDPETGARVNVGKHRAFKSPNRLPLPGWMNLTPDLTGTAGWTKMVRKYQMKLLQVQIGALLEQTDPVGYCQTQCDPPTEAHKMKPDHYAKFVWVNGGHSASAGHGNFYDESYTANLGKDVQPILQKIGLDWQVKNYAMGGTDSGEEVALCHNSIFGKDVDSLSWDYGMCDGSEMNKMILYSYRTARLSQLDNSYSQPGNIKHRPSLVAVHQGEDYNWILQTMESLGMTVLGMDWKFEKTIEAAFPDMFGMTDEQIDALPPYVKYFRCKEAIETGDPGCGDHKYNDTVCEWRRAKASWHPGFKYHAMIGHLMAFTVIHLCFEALNNMHSLEPATIETPQVRLARLKLQLATLDAAEQADYDRIFQTPVPDHLLDYFYKYQWRGKDPENDKEAMKVMDLEWFIKDPTLCHTAMLPAEIRFMGILNDNREFSGDVFDQHYEHAVFQDEIKELENPRPDSGRNATPFGYEEVERANLMAMGALEGDVDKGCPVRTNVDQKDYFYISSAEDWRGLEIPNNAETSYYTEFDATKSHGFIFICMAKCDWGHCPDGDIRQNVYDFTTDPVYGGITMEVNGVGVTNVTCMWLCCAIKHDDPDPARQYTWTPNSKGTYEFRTMISGGTGYGYARFSSFILL